MNAQKYTEILDDALLGTLSDQNKAPENVIFQHDNDPKHTSKRAKGWLAENQLSVLPWPSNSPDMNIIEHAWSYLDRRVCARALLPQTTDQLWAALQEEWYSIDELVIKNLYASMPCRVEALSRAHGGNTRYGVYVLVLFVFQVNVQFNICLCLIE
jgi:transposase